MSRITELHCEPDREPTAADQCFHVYQRPTAAFSRLQETLASRKDTTLIESTPEYLRVEFRTALFVDDGEFLLDRDHQVIHVRSASRLGYSDLGKNRSRMEEVRRQFELSLKKP